MSWNFIHGHHGVRERLNRAYSAGRLAHAYLFCGPAGVGKKLFAMELAKALLCERTSSNQLVACDQCSSCHLVAAGTHPDVQMLGRSEDKTQIIIDDMLKFIGKLALKPSRGSRRIAIVDDADEFGVEAANSFLKTLEEPPPGSILILVATDPELQMPTIRSRCQVIPFGSLDNRRVEEILRASGVTDAGLIQRLVPFAAGSPGLALSFANSDLWATRDQLVVELLKPKPDSYSLSKAWMERIESAGKEGALQRVEAMKLLRLVVDLFRQALPFTTDSPPAHVEGPMLANIARRFGPEGLLDCLDRLLQAEMHNERSVQLVLLVEGVVDALLLKAVA